MGANREGPARDRHFMGQALDLARNALGFTSPKPPVGCVIVREGRVVGRGATASGGRPHAEAQALGAAGARARGATAYVSLEPCAHFGVTSRCADALVDARIARVVFGCRDPDARMRGRGAAILRRAGVDVTGGVLEDECKRLNEGFFMRLRLGRPFATLKLATSLDGRIAAADGGSRWISSARSRALVHRWRRESDAVIVGVGTVIADNPRLTCRIAGGRDPVRVIIDPHLRTPPRARVLRERSTAGAIVVTTRANLSRARRLLEGANAEVLPIADRNGQLRLAAMMHEFGVRGWNRVLVEGGAHLATAMLRERLIDRVAFFVAPKIIGSGLPAIEDLSTRSIARAIKLRNLSARQVGADWLLEADAAPVR